MDETDRPADRRDRPPLDELVEEVRAENPDRTTRREALELELMREDRSEEGVDADLDAGERDDRD